jgi:hypothetical protein
LLEEVGRLVCTPSGHSLPIAAATRTPDAAARPRRAAPRCRRAYEQAGLDAAAAGGEREKQAERVRALWHRQLAVPLAGGDAALAAYEAWEQAAGTVRDGGHGRGASARGKRPAQAAGPRGPVEHGTHMQLGSRHGHALRALPHVRLVPRTAAT